MNKNVNDYIRPYNLQYKKKTVVYKITNPIGQSYIGSTTRLYYRLSYHAKGMNHSKNNLNLLHQSVLLYGFENHKIEILWEVKGKRIKMMYKKEDFFIRLHDTWNHTNPNGLNLKGANNNNIHSMLKIPHRKMVYQYKITDGSYMGEYETIHDAARQIGKINGTANISKACKGGKVYAYGYYWSFNKQENYKPEKSWKERKLQKVYKLYKDGTLIKDVYNSVAEAASKHNMDCCAFYQYIYTGYAYQGKFIFLKVS